MKLPESHKPFTDKYFLRSNEILKAEGLNPMVRAQVFIRKGPGIVDGIEEAVNIIETYSSLQKHGGHLYTLSDGDQYDAKETLMVIEGPIQDIMELETMYLGILSAATTRANGGEEPNLAKASAHMKNIVEIAKRPVSYFGARHWHYAEDASIAKAAFDGGASSCSTDIGGAYKNQEGMGTIPHALENIFAWKYGVEHAVVEATKAFDRHMPEHVPRIALIDYANREITDSIATANALNGKLSAVRVDTCGENIAQGASAEHAEKYWGGSGVTVSGVHALRQALDAAGHNSVDIILTSGFGDINKVQTFVEAEKTLNTTLFNGLGVGGIYSSRSATMDIVAVGDTLETLVPMSKVGREYRPNTRLERRW